MNLNTINDSSAGHTGQAFEIKNRILFFAVTANESTGIERLTIVHWGFGLLVKDYPHGGLVCLVQGVCPELHEARSVERGGMARWPCMNLSLERYIQNRNYRSSSCHTSNIRGSRVCPSGEGRGMATTISDSKQEPT
jgi:hypothetical protein